MTKNNKYYIWLLVCAGIVHAGTPPLNLFNPYDVLLIPPRWPGTCLQFTVAFEDAFKVCAYQADDDETCTNWRKCANVLQLWQDEQDPFAAVKGDNFTSRLGEFPQLFNIDDDNSAQVLFRPCGKMSIQNLMFSARYHFGWNGTLGVHLPVYHMELKNVVWSQRSDNTRVESNLVPDMISALETLGNINLGGWKRTGIGDLSALVYWYRDYPQAKPVLKNVHVSLRVGLTFPTGKKKDEDKILALPFGYDGGLGVIGGGGLELWFGQCLRGGMDAEFLQIFGTLRNRRIKTDAAQTDLLFLTKVPAFKEPGFLQHYTLYLDGAYLWRGLSAKLAYQYTKQNADRLALCSDHFETGIANCAESLQDWSTHSLVANLTYDFYRGKETALKPFISVFYKHGFNGKRALLADTVGFALSLSF